MTWLNLLFLHWRIEPTTLRPLIPTELDIDTFDGSAWVGLVPFQMYNCRFAGFGWVPTLRNFYECNVRTYVTCNGRPGVWFFSLDAQNLAPVIGGRFLWKLNYIYSKFNATHNPPLQTALRSTPPHATTQQESSPVSPMTPHQTSTHHMNPNQSHDYALTRHVGPWPSAHTHIRWTVGDQRPLAQPGSLEHFLTERYNLFTKRRGRIMFGRIHHNPWPLHDATAEVVSDTLLQAAGLNINTHPDSTLASPTIDVLGYPLQHAHDHTHLPGAQ